MSLLVLASCAPRPGNVAKTQAGKSIFVTTENDVIQKCLDGVVYVKFSGGESSWGGPKFNRDGTIATCN